MLYTIDGEQLRLSHAHERHLQLRAQHNGQRQGPIRTRRDYLKACIRALPPAQARQLLEWVERHGDNNGKGRQKKGG